MSVNELVTEIQHMNSIEKLELLETLWESLAHDIEQSEVPMQHQEEIQNRFDRYQKKPGLALPWETAKKDILTRYEVANNPRSSK